MNLLQVENVSKTFKRKVALNPFYIEMQEGMCIAICGGNGAGKSTLLHILAGISRPTSGNVYLNGVNMLKKRADYVAKIGYMPDDFHAQEMMSVLEFFTFYAKIRKVDEKQIHEVLERIGLYEKKKELISKLSKGMRQRLLFGQACIGQPSLLILDEPTNGLDPFWVDSFVEMLKDIKRKGTMIMFSTHMMDVAAEVGDRILFLKSGAVTNQINGNGSKVDRILQLLQLHRQT